MAVMDKRTLDREISEYEDGKLNRTNARDLAALYIIRDYLYPEKSDMAIPISTGISYAGPDTVGNYGDTPFYQAIAGKDATSAWRVMAQLAETLAAVYEPLYQQMLRQLEDI